MTKNDISLENLKINAENAHKRIVNKISNSPLIMSNIYGKDLFFKAENFQFSGSFKIRGAFSKLTKLDKTGVLKNAKLITASSGNHGLACSYAAKELGGDLTVVLPETVASVKLEKIKSYGISVILKGQESGEAETHAQKLAEDEGYLYVSPYNDLDIIAGQGTIGLEVIEQLNKYNLIPDKILVPTGGGGLIAGIATAIKKRYKNTNIYCVEPSKFSDYSKSLKNMKITKNNMNNISICDSLLASEPGKITFKINSALLKRGITVTDTQVLKAINYAYKNLGLIVEPGGAVALAAILNSKTLLKKKTVVAILSGSNIDPLVLKKAII